ncbi:hypothetical protein E6A55_32925 (plasmid) [Cupriavidus necator H16]|uniref:Uncharacterized protein n=1 Tax=Cupriavidus necator (strain ATCC 17699 / DSM 428 / KCTC 22496 / NCIMB 10442 / H16 / Stanier 337) TaxID=381666 RepID=A0AAE5ZKN3_CUPNH|nr:hypothetical protein [Cupriavidus necator]QCC05401.1 hypothetical protein E6A55_32925 [Cupriavidus necator H16]QQB81570.1 hypothetical protein I6H87_32900 [Cupriavidus necator]
MIHIDFWSQPPDFAPKVRSPPNELRASFFCPSAVRDLERFFLNPQWGSPVNENIGGGTLTYRAVQDPRAPERTFWRFTIYGIVMGHAPGRPGVRADAIYGVSNPPRE